MSIDYNQYLETNKHKIYKKLIKLEEIQPNDKFEFINAIETPDDDKSKWEIELILNDSILCYWRTSGSMFEQICRHNKTNNTNIFFLQPDRKMRIGKSYTWLLKISTSPIDKPTDTKTIQEKEQPNVAQQQLDRSPGVGREDALPVSVSSHTEQPQDAPKEVGQDTSTPKSVEAELTTQEDPVEASAEALPAPTTNERNAQIAVKCSLIYALANECLHVAGKDFIGFASDNQKIDVKQAAKMWLWFVKNKGVFLDMDGGQPKQGINRTMVDKVSYQCRELLGLAHPVDTIPDAAKVTVEVPAPTPEPLSLSKPIVGINPDAYKKAKDNIEKKGFGNIFEDDEEVGKLAI